jgi:hypothetical protein
VELDFPIEFLVNGTPLSQQSARAEARESWKEAVRAASRSALPNPHFASDGRIAVTIFYFLREPMQGDIDNIAKLILDALCRHIYIDDKQVERLVVQKFEPGREFDFDSPSPALRKAMTGERPLLFIRLSDDPYEDLA